MIFPNLPHVLPPRDLEGFKKSSTTINWSDLKLLNGLPGLSHQLPQSCPVDVQYVVLVHADFEVARWLDG